MSMNALLAKIEQSGIKPTKPVFEIGDTVDVHVRIQEGDKERIQLFNGLVISMRGDGMRESFTVRRIVDGEGVERTFPINSPKLADVTVKRRAVVRRAKLYFLRDRVGKQAYRLKERQIVEKSTTGRSRTRVKARKAKQAEAAANPAAEPKKKKARKPAKAKT